MRARALIWCLGACACSSTASPPRHIGLSIAGAGQSDSVWARLQRPLSVVVTDTGTANGFVVIFASWVSSLSRSDTGVEEGVVYDTTGKDGKASVYVRLGPYAGRQLVTVSVPALATTDTVSFTATPGNAVGIVALPADTTVYVGRQATLHAALVDRYGNLRSDPVTYMNPTGPISLSGATVTGQSIGRGSVDVTARTYFATTAISVVPQGTLATLSDSLGVIEFNLDGSNYRRLTSTIAQNPNWGPSGTIAFDGDAVPFNGHGIQAIDTGGTIRTLDDGGGPTGPSDAYPQWSRDGAWVYFTRYDPGDPVTGAAIWRVHGDGTGTTVVTAGDSGLDVYPSPSPDGQKIAFLRLNNPQPGIRILNLANGTTTALGISGQSLRWAPMSNRIAYIVLSSLGPGGTLMIANADGSGAHPVNDRAYDLDIDWSPDETWLVAHNSSTQRIELISVSTGVTLPLGYTGSVGSPTWRPY